VSVSIRFRNLLILSGGRGPNRTDGGAIGESPHVTPIDKSDVRHLPPEFIGKPLQAAIDLQIGKCGERSAGHTGYR
jgi:hypothetical protein